MRRFLSLLFLLFLAPGLQAKTYRLAILPQQAGGSYWDAFHAGAIRAERELAKEQINVELTWLPPGGAGTAAEQAALVEKVAAARFDALLIAPLDADALRPAVEAASRNGLPVLIFDTPLSSALTVTYVGTNNFEAGQIAGGFLAKQIGEQGSILIVGDPERSPNILQREKGFVDGARIFPNVLLLSSGDYADPLPAVRSPAAGAMIKRFSGRLAGVFSANPEAVNGVLQGLEEAGLGGSKVIHVAFGSAPELVGALRAGKLQALIADNPFAIGVQAVRSAVDSLEGKRLQPRLYVQTSLVTSDKIDDPANAMALHPAIGDYLKDGKEINASAPEAKGAANDAR